MDLHDLSKLCRSCMNVVDSSKSRNIDELSIEKFAFCTNIRISDDGDEMPKQLCYLCYDRINSCYEFIRETQRVDEKLRYLISRNQTYVIVKEEPKGKTSIKQELNTSSANLLIYNSPEVKPERQPLDEELPLSPQASPTPSNDVKPEREQLDEELPLSPQASPTPSYDSENQNNKDHRKATNTRKIASKYKHGKADNIVSKENDGIKKFTCSICGKTYVGQAWLLRHISKDHQEKVYNCTECNKSFPKLSQLKSHKTRHTADTRRFRCHCGAQFPTVGQLNQHSRTHSDERPFGCDHCQKQFKMKSVLKTHMAVHYNLKPFLCSVCGKRFSRAGNLEEHSRVHSGARPYRCARCPYRAATAASLRRHRLAHITRVRCDECGKEFHDRSSVMRHKRIHSGARPYQCSDCNRSFIDSWKRKDHMMRTHKYTLEALAGLKFHPKSDLGDNRTEGNMMNE